ncbi:MAG: Non-canonical purine NTP pyrophosphatase [Microgenomates bacterium OLB22]|nr:MAG: Non-canonical purine NTP pyrophosphatase [Microgenomates bacterium OLB22]
MSNKEVLYATNNPGKVGEVSKFLEHHGIRVVSPKDLGIDLDVPETGSTLEENAYLKVKAFIEVSGGRIVLSDDTGLEIDALDGAPGIHVRRWKDGVTRMSDEEIIKYCLEQMKYVAESQRTAQFRTVIAMALPSGEIEMFDGVLRGLILESPQDIRIEGFPFASLFVVPEWNMLLAEVERMTIEEKRGKHSHRESAIQKVVPRLQELL